MVSQRAEDCRLGHRKRDREGTVCVSLWPERAQQPSREPEGLLGLFSFSLSLSLAFSLSSFARLRPKIPHVNVRQRQRGGGRERSSAFLHPPSAGLQQRSHSGGPALKVEVYV